MAPLAPAGQLGDALGPAKLRKDGVRLGLLSVLSIVYALLFEQGRQRFGRARTKGAKSFAATLVA